MTKSESVPRLFADVEHYICSATTMLEKGEYTQLFELEDKVRDLCQAVLEIPLEEGRRFTGKLDDLRRQLDILQQLMESHQNKVRDQLASLGIKKRANEAYAKSDVMSKKED